MAGGVAVESELHFFDREEVDDELEFQKEGVRYVHFFGLEEAIDRIEAGLATKELYKTKRALAERLIEYRIYDA